MEFLLIKFFMNIILAIFVIYCFIKLFSYLNYRKNDYKSEKELRDTLRKKFKNYK